MQCDDLGGILIPPEIAGSIEDALRTGKIIRGQPIDLNAMTGAPAVLLPAASQSNSMFSTVAELVPALVAWPQILIARPTWFMKPIGTGTVPITSGTVVAAAGAIA